jgi:basic amino acid/polyamine antiporter, APA family
MEGTRGADTGLVRGMGLFDAASLVIGAVIGSGIFMTTGFILQDVPSPGLMLCVWVAGGLIAMSGALSFGELGAMYPQAGGQYIYIREAFGSWAAFFYGWGFFGFIMCGGIAALAVAFAEFAGYFFPALSMQNALLHVRIFGFPYSLSAGQVVAAVSVVVLTWVNSFGIGSGKVVQNVLTVFRIGLVLFLIVFGLASGHKTGVAGLSDLFCAGGNFVESLRGFCLGLVAVFWTYDGWYSASCAAGEIRKPGRNIPLSLILGTSAVTIVYVLVNLVYVLALPVDAMKGVARVGELVVTALFGPSISFWFSAAVMISIFGCLNATILYGPRVYYAMASDGAFFRGMARLHPKHRVPTVALYGQAAWTVLLCLTGTYQSLYEYVIFAVLLFFAATGAALIVLRRKKPDIPRPYRALGYPVVPVFFVAASSAIFLNTVVAQPGRSLRGLLILAAGIPAYLVWRKKSRRLEKGFPGGGELD